MVTNKNNRSEIQVKTPEGWKTISEICEKHGLLRRTVVTRVRNAKTYKEVIKKLRTYKKDREFPISRIKDKTGTKCVHVKIGGKWKTVSEIAKETGKPVRTIFNRINRDVDPYQKNKSVKKPQSSTLWEGVPDHIRKACESGSNKDLLAV